MAIDYKKLTVTAKKACEKSSEAAKGDNGGTCNMDAVFLVLPGASEEKTITALKNGGFNAYKTKFMGSPCFMLIPPCCGQGDSRVRACRAIDKD